MLATTLGETFTMSLELKGKQVQALRDALVSAFRNYADLSMMVLYEMDVNLEHHVARGPMNQVTFELIQWAEAHGRLGDLIAGARAQVPGNPQLRQFAIEVALTSDAPPKGKLEAMVLESVPFQEVNRWRATMAQRERTVCRVEIPKGAGVGTGLLVGPGVVLTNWHVAELLEEQSENEEAGVRFDYVVQPDGLSGSEGKFYSFSKNCLIDSSGVTDLDFALLRIDGDPGNETVGEEQKRGWVKVQPRELNVGEVLLVLQHPLATHLNLSAGTITAVNTLHKRVTYTANTAPGSSGSPVFTLGWELVALHHYGQKDGNMGIPITSIWQQLKDRDKLGELKIQP
jgi:S1-C subfamily serine protease